MDRKPSVLTVAIRSYPHGLERRTEAHAVIAVDVIRATTTAVTARALGHRCYPVTSVEAAMRVAARTPNALLLGELRGVMPEGFHLNNSPAALAARQDQRPIVLLSTNGTTLIDSLRDARVAFVACFRNMSATVREIVRLGLSATLIGAISRGEFRDEDQICCAWMAGRFLEEGYRPEDAETAEVVRKWRDAGPRDLLGSRSVEYLRRSDQLPDLDFILAHVDDLDFSCRIVGDQILSDPARVERVVEAETR